MALPVALPFIAGVEPAPTGGLIDVVSDRMVVVDTPPRSRSVARDSGVSTRPDDRTVTT